MIETVCRDRLPCRRDRAAGSSIHVRAFAWEAGVPRALAHDFWSPASSQYVRRGGRVFALPYLPGGQLSSSKSTSPSCCGELCDVRPAMPWTSRQPRDLAFHQFRQPPQLAGVDAHAARSMRASTGAAAARFRRRASTDGAPTPPAPVVSRAPARMSASVGRWPSCRSRRRAPARPRSIPRDRRQQKGVAHIVLESARVDATRPSANSADSRRTPPWPRRRPRATLEVAQVTCRTRAPLHAPRRPTVIQRTRLRPISRRHPPLARRPPLPATPSAPRPIATRNPAPAVFARPSSFKRLGNSSSV